MGLLNRFKTACSQTNEDPSANNDADSATAECPQKKQKTKSVRIDSVGFLNGDDTTVLTSHGYQYVNLPRDAKFCHPEGAANIDRMGRSPRIKVKFNQPGNHKFTLNLLADKKNHSFSDGEKARNPHFADRSAEREYTTDDDGTKIVDDFELSCAGQNNYRVQARDEFKHSVKSFSLHTWRQVFIKEIRMTGLTSVASNIAAFKSEFERNRVKIISLGSENIARMQNIGSDADSNRFVQRCRAAWAGSDAAGREPYGVAIGYTDHLAVRHGATDMIEGDVKVGPDTHPVHIRIKGPSDTNPRIDHRPLWKDIVTGEGWFVSCTYLEDGKRPGIDDIAIAEDKCTPVAWAANGTYCGAVDVDVSGLPAGTGTITLRVHYVDRMRAGLSFGGGNLICVCTRAWWTDDSTADQNQVMIHEMGHKVNMVTDGTGMKPDKPKTYYSNDQGHVGPHCRHGLPKRDPPQRYDGPKDGGKSKCVMYGATNGKFVFCPNCVKPLRKMDLSSGWSRM